MKIDLKIKLKVCWYESQMTSNLMLYHSEATDSSRYKMVNWLFTLGFPVQTNTNRSFLVVFEVVYVVRWYKYR